MEFIIIALFGIILFICLLMGFSIVYALVAGLVLFLFYGYKKGFTGRELFEMSLSGVITIKNLLITFLIIGALTALWRSSGTIAYIVCVVTQLINPKVFLPAAFLLNCLISFLIGTSFGTAATIGVICMTMASAMNINPVLVGGAVMSGAFFGDRCSPVSTSALLISQLTRTEIFDNIKNMFKSSAVPFVISGTAYFILGYFLNAEQVTVPNLYRTFSKEFVLHPVTVIPAAVILLLSVFRVKIKTAMLVSILTAFIICTFVQNISVGTLLYQAVFGFCAENVEAGMINGGGVMSMFKVTCIVCLSSCYSGIFEKTGLFDSAKTLINKIREKYGNYISVMVTSIAANVLACNQTLSIMLTHQLCNENKNDKSQFV